MSGRQYEATTCRNCGEQRRDHNPSVLDGIVRRFCPDGRESWFKPIPSRIAASHSFGEDEVRLLEFVFKTLAVGSTPSTVNRKPGFQTLYRKIVRMKHKIEALHAEREALLERARKREKTEASAG